MSAMAMQQGPPYPPRTAGPGGRPSIYTDVPIAAVFICLYVGAAAGHMTRFQLNRKAGHKFVPSALLFGFCMSRILTCSLRIGSATHPNNISLSIAAGIFLNAGILLVYVINILFAQRILRARQPSVGWNPVLRVVFKLILVLIVVFLFLLIPFIVVTFYTRNPSLLNAARHIQQAAITYFLIVTTLPYWILLLAFRLPRSDREETFGTGSLRTKVLILLVGTTLVVYNAVYKAGTTWASPHPVNDPAWYQSKASYWCFYFVPEVLVLYFYLFMRIDRRFWVPNGSGERKSYVLEGKKIDEKDGEREESV
ncbi:uncharacterized protein MYCGRDRAFT_69060 [Zymoseptoria tritici IPO323]|uniref:Uncharacterized protein n=1 Tax=Zymoseptoria tritici (strain CBS 115943 / IPO323) TaxID=336722 RepID=F9X427_ZYMTI|nr:uncharacterized protein MYCGRDRAFT_69060 [Zymoseptoria tritici IPO323]EGP90268.1 hypothetical protein MYCGRDRAFT_69060 [Zymoseptoria tritici IPO323]